MTAVRYIEALWEKVLRFVMVYNEQRLKCIFLEGLRSCTCYSMSTCWGAHKKGTLHSVSHHAASLVKISESSHSSASLMREDHGSRLSSDKSCRQPIRIIPVLAIKVDDYSSTKSLQGIKDIGGSHFRGYNKNKNAPTTVASIKLQQQTPLNRLQENTAFCRLCSSWRYQAEECHFLPLQVRLTLLQ